MIGLMIWIISWKNNKDGDHAEGSIQKERS